MDIYTPEIINKQQQIKYTCKVKIKIDFKSRYFSSVSFVELEAIFNTVGFVLLIHMKVHWFSLFSTYFSTASFTKSFSIFSFARRDS